ncbi:hypothetical protein MBANPS3_011179 [Mucor bainieri]
MYSNYLNHPQPSTSPIMYHRFRHNSDPQLAPLFSNARRMSYGDYLSYTSDSSLETSPVGSTLDYYHHQQAPSPLAIHSDLPSNNHKSCCPCIHSNGYYADQPPAHRHSLDWQSTSCNQFTSPPLQQQQQQQQQAQFMMFDALPTPTIVSSQLMTPSLSSSSCSSQMHELSIYDLLELVPTQHQQQEAYCVSPPSPFVSHDSASTNDDDGDDEQDDNKQTVNEANQDKCTKANSCAAATGGGKAKVKKSTRARRNDVSGVTSSDRKKYKKTSSEPDVKQFLCEYDDCGKLFKRSEHLKRHIKSIHTKEKPYSCPYKDCGKSFARTDNLSQHIRIHRNNKGSSAATAMKATRTKTKA